jgi:two-component system OmpR family response regulator
VRYACRRNRAEPISTEGIELRQPLSVLLIEDDRELARSVTQFISENGCDVVHCADAREGLERARGENFHVIILDRLLPHVDGLTLVRKIRTEGRYTPVIFLTTMDGIDDRVQGLEAGGDDYLVKPFALEELLARVRVLARRSQSNQTELRAGSIQLDLLRRAAIRDGKAVELLPQEFRLLEYLVRHANAVVTRKMLLENVWNIHFDPHTSVVESHMSRLRAKLNAGFAGDVIQTVRGIGYQLLAPD